MTLDSELQQRSPEWYAARKGRVTGSNVGAILGLDPNRGPDDVLRAMVREYHGAEREFKGNVATDYGTMHEAGAIAEFEMEHGKKVSETGFHLHPELDWLGASPDGFVDVSPDSFSGVSSDIIEVKCPYGKRDGGDFKPLADQPHYYAQIQIELLCTCAKRCYFWQWSPHDTRLEMVYPDDEWVGENLPKLHQFYDRFLSELDNPDHLKPKRKEINNAKARKLIEELDEVKDQIDFATARKKEIMDELVSLAGERDALVCGRKLTKVEKAGSVAYAKVVKDHCKGIDLEPYRGKPSVSWRLS